MLPEKEDIAAVNGADVGGCPVPLAGAHEDVVGDRTLFMNTLRSFHFSLGSKFLIPVIGGKELNLHLLYVEVTRRGGYDKVIMARPQSQTGYPLGFQPADYSPQRCARIAAIAARSLDLLASQESKVAYTTSASYALRKHYFTILCGYELVYFLRIQTTGSSFQALGTIDGKFDCGYFVSVGMGNETLKGVLYHPGPRASPTSSSSPSPHMGHPAKVPSPCTAIVPYAPRFHQPGRRSRKRRAGNPGRPKPNRSGYNFFFAEKHSKLKSIYPNREREFTKMIGESWNNLPPEERVVYQNYGLKDKERYQKEMKEYKEKLKTGNL